MAYAPIESYGMIGDLRTVALVSDAGSVDFLCWPRFDSPSVFAALLDDARGGRFSIEPELDGARRKQIYLPDTAVLLTRFLSDSGIAELSDFMPLWSDGAPQCLVRRAKTVHGEVRFRLDCRPAFDYARAEHRAERADGEVLFASRGDDATALRLLTPVPVRVDDGAARAEFVLRAGECVTFVLELARGRGGDSPTSAPNYAAAAFKDTVNFWRRWTGRSSYRGRWRETVSRSALTLKLLTSSEFGTLVAAPTFSLPERLGGRRNWDYRYTWIRDASFTLYALIRLGYTAEAHDFMRWIEARCEELAPDGSLQIMYGIDGRHDLTEHELDHLEGYRGSRPVRIGNGAYDQLQLDIYGALMDAVYLANKHGDPISHDLWANLTRLIEWVCDNWCQADEGIWEVRGGRHEFLSSRVLCWVAVDRGVRLARKRSLPAPARWQQVRDTIYRDVFAKFWNERRGAFVQHEGTDATDSASLLMPLLRFISPTDPRWLGTLRAVEEDLVEDSMVYRYRVGEAASDGFDTREGTFTMSSFWYVECLSRAGDYQKARLVLEKALAYANHVGLYAEELGPCGEHLGNFPQAYPHLGLISAAFHLDRELDRAGVGA